MKTKIQQLLICPALLIAANGQIFHPTSTPANIAVIDIITIESSPEIDQNSLPNLGILGGQGIKGVVHTYDPWTPGPSHQNLLSNPYFTFDNDWTQWRACRDA